MMTPPPTGYGRKWEGLKGLMDVSGVGVALIIDPEKVRLRGSLRQLDLRGGEAEGDKPT